MHEFPRAVVGIGTNLETSVLTVLTLNEIGVPEIWAKATSVKHGKILSQVGARHVIYPEAEMGERVAHLHHRPDARLHRVRRRLRHRQGARAAARRSAGHWPRSGLRSKWGVTVVGVKLPGQDFTYARPETVVPQGCILIVAGDTAKVEQFAART